MKILEFTRSYFPSIGGMEKFVSDRLKIYHDLGYDYEVITTTHTERQINISKKLKNIKYLKSFTPFEYIPFLFREFKSDFDILSVNQVGYYYSYASIKIAYKIGKKIIVTPHFYFHTSKYKLIKKLLSIVILPKIFKMANIVVCFTEIEKNFWLEKFPFIKNKVIVIPHYFDITKIQYSPISDYKNKFILYLGRSEKNKRIDLLIEVFNSTITDYQLYLTIFIEELSPKIQSIVNHNNNIKLLGKIEEEYKLNLLSNCSALILPTEYEAFGIVNLEASYFKKPLLVSNLIIFKEILDERGVIYFENNFDSLKIKLLEFFNLSEEKKNEMGRANFNNLSKFSYTKVKDQYKELFEDLIR